MRAVPVALMLGAATAWAEPRTLEVEPTIHQQVLLLTTPSTTAGGIGGGVGVQLTWRGRYLAQLDAGALWMIDNPIAVRLAGGVQRAGAWAPAIWLAGTTIWNDRVEIVMAPGERRGWPVWAIGVRASPLRFHAPWGTVSALEPGIGTDLRGTLVELTVLQAGARW